MLIKIIVIITIMTVREKIIELFSEVGTDYSEKGIAVFGLHTRHDIHAFYRFLREPNKVVHLQGYPGMSSEQEARVWARLMDYNKMMEIRRNCGVSIGNEHDATIQRFPNFEIGVMIPYSSKVLEDMLGENCSELR